MLKVHLTLKLDISFRAFQFRAFQSHNKQVKNINLSQAKSNLRRNINYKTPEYVNKIQSIYYLERQCFW